MFRFVQSELRKAPEWAMLQAGYWKVHKVYPWRSKIRALQAKGKVKTDRGMKWHDAFRQSCLVVKTESWGVTGNNIQRGQVRLHTIYSNNTMC